MLSSINSVCVCVCVSLCVCPSWAFTATPSQSPTTATSSPIQIYGPSWVLPPAPFKWTLIIITIPFRAQRLKFKCINLFCTRDWGILTREFVSSQLLIPLLQWDVDWRGKLVCSGCGCSVCLAARACWLRGGMQMRSVCSRPLLCCE